MSQDFKNSLNLPNTKFPMKASLQKTEPLRLEKWQTEKIYEQMVESRKLGERKILHDGPPYANGHLHVGHALNKIIKDVMTRVSLLNGFYSPYIPGWDCHGLPIELQVEHKLGDKRKETSSADFRKLCRTHAEEFIQIQREEFMRMGVIGDWYNPYVTMDYEYESIILEELYKFLNNGSLYKGFKPVYWCPSCETALAEAEVEYKDKKSPSIYVKFKAQEDALNALDCKVDGDVSFVIWTTTPWTIPSNVSISMNPEISYSLLKVLSSENSSIDSGECLILADDLIEKTITKINITEYEIISKVDTSKLEMTSAKHPIYDRNSKIILGDYVTSDDGTGLVHNSPAHGIDDYTSALKYSLEGINIVEDNGHFKDDVELFGGLFIFKANKSIIEYMRENRSLLYSEDIEHSYAHCWRCKKPLIYRATPQWFISMDEGSLRERTLEAIKTLDWKPSWGEERMASMIENRPDWCVSRQRLWGVPIAVFKCAKCEKVHMPKELQKKVLKEFESHGADIWYSKDASYFLSEGYTCEKCGSDKFIQEKDVLDVWFDSGSSYSAASRTSHGVFNEEDIYTYMEGSDQHRGWFQSSLLHSMGTRGKAPYKQVITHGFVVDGTGKKMSKSVGNVINPDEIINEFGAEILRLWVASEDYSEDIRISKNILKTVSEAYRKVRNTSRFMLGNITDFNPDTDSVPYEELMELDKYILGRWEKVKSRILEAYDSYQYHIFYHTILNFCIVDLSAMYLDILKDRCYTEAKKGLKRRSAQTAIFNIIKEFAVVASPIMPFLSDEIWEHLPEFSKKEDSIFLSLFPKANETWSENKLDEKFEILLGLKKEVNQALEVARNNGIVNFPLDSEILLSFKDKSIMKNLEIDETLERFLIVSKVHINPHDEFEVVFSSQDNEIQVGVIKSLEERCARCWTHHETVATSEDNLCHRCSDVIAQMNGNI